MTSPVSAAAPAPSGIRRIVAASLIGTTIEWYDNSFDQRYGLCFSFVRALAVSTEPAPERRVLCPNPLRR
ncbi:hypothetical protein ACFVJ8_01795 [Streptomyces yangpuensis]|uniref:hypothetical protein n=1 Tax=Streptomyces yangpuensis TaxID=1648182 RepID=UPI00363336DB